MSDPKQLPHLIKLLDDDSVIVKETVIEELASFGPTLDRALTQERIELSPDQRKLLHGLLEDHQRSWLKDEWNGWQNISSDKEKLETALNLLVEFQYGTHYPKKLTPLLDNLAAEYNANYRMKDVRQLAHFLFTVKQLRGVEQSDYYNPLNTNLVYVLERKRGIPISLSCIYMLIGHRLGLSIDGCNFPGHFLALVTSAGQTHVVDCYNGGRFLSEKEFSRLTSSASISVQDIMQLKCDAPVIIARMLRNLINAYQQAHQDENVALMTELHEKLGLPES